MPKSKQGTLKKETIAEKVSRLQKSAGRNSEDYIQEQMAYYVTLSRSDVIKKIYEKQRRTIVAISQAFKLERCVRLILCQEFENLIKRLFGLTADEMDLTSRMIELDKQLEDIFNDHGQ